MPIPVGIMIAATQISVPAPSLLVSFVGGVLLGITVLFIPFVQTQFAVSGSFREFLTFRTCRDLFRKAPLAFWFALFITLLFAIPLYAVNIELGPQCIFWLANIVFVIFILPARLLVGWAMSRAMKQEAPKNEDTDGSRHSSLSRWSPTTYSSCDRLNT